MIRINHPACDSALNGSLLSRFPRGEGSLREELLYTLRLWVRSLLRARSDPFLSPNR